jgi:ABC-type branched-subunit amino acid transport system ATPase component
MLLGKGRRELLEVNGIHVAYGRARVLHDVSLRLNRGEMVFIVGRNGAGKTTLLKSISGLMKPSEGHITYEGQEINGLSPVKLARRGMRYVAQDKKVFANLTVRGNIELAAYASGEEMSKAISMVTNIYPDMGQFLDNKAGGLSGGQREILLIGRAMIGNPKLLLIDEPTEGLAAIVIEDILRILRKMKEESVSAIIVEQNLSVVGRLADRIYVLKEGKVISELRERAEIGNTTELEAYL